VEVRLAEAREILDLRIETPQLATSYKTRLVLTSKYHFQGAPHAEGVVSFNQRINISLPSRASEADFKAISRQPVLFHIQGQD
jgi:hypothetical protein